ncbi:hypothetical protein [Nocardia sp. NPDC004415]
MDHSTAPLLAAYHALGRYGFTPPGHRQGRGIDDRVLRALGTDAFRSDMLMTPGLDDRLARRGLLAEAEELIVPSPAVVPGERLDEAVMEYLRTGVAAGMNLPDAADPRLDTVRVVRDR